MRITKLIETQLDLTNPDDIMNPNKEELCMRLLNNKYAGKCYQGCYIIKVTKIVNYSSTICSRSKSDGSAFIYVRMLVDAVAYKKGEVINGCKVVKKEIHGYVHLTSQYAGIQIPQHPVLKSIREEQIVPVICRAIRADPANEFISILGQAFVPVYNDIYVIITTSVSKEGELLIKQKLDELNSLIKLTASYTKDAKENFKFFADLLYPYSKKKTDKFKKMDIKDIGKIKNGIISLPASLDLRDLKFNVGGVQDMAREMTCDAAAILFIDTFIDYYNLLINFVETYPTVEDRNTYRIFWAAYKSLKSP